MVRDKNLLENNLMVLWNRTNSLIIHFRHKVISLRTKVRQLAGGPDPPKIQEFRPLWIINICTPVYPQGAEKII